MQCEDACVRACDACMHARACVWYVHACVCQNFNPRPPQVRTHNSSNKTHGSLNPRGSAAKDGRVLVGDEILSIGERMHTNHAPFTFVSDACKNTGKPRCNVT